MSDQDLSDLAYYGIRAKAELEKRHGTAGKALIVSKLENAMDGDIQQVFEDLKHAADAETQLSAVRSLLDKQAGKFGSSQIFWQREMLLRELLSIYQGMYEQERRTQHVLKNQDIVLWMTSTASSLMYVSLFAMIIGRTRPTLRLLQQLQPQIESLPIEKFIEDFPSEDVQSHDQLRRNHQRVKDLVADFINGKTPDFDTLRDMFVEGIENSESIENITAMLRELQEIAAASRPGPDAETDTEIAKRFARQAKHELGIKSPGHGDIDRIRKTAQTLLLRDRNVEDEAQLDDTYQLAYGHLVIKHKSIISRWVK
jgi:hypothetical protein